MVFRRDGERLEDRETPVAGADEVVIRVEYCGICGSDLHATDEVYVDGAIMGHELAGIVQAVGSAVTTWAVGDRVVVNPNGGWCGECDHCRAGAHNMCAAIWPKVVGLAQNGGLAPLAAIHHSMLRRLPDTVSTRQGAWVEPLAVAIRTVNRSEIERGASAIVFGAGPIGLLVTAVLRTRGVGSIAVVEPSAARRATATLVGATEVIDPASTDLTARYSDAMEAPEFGFECTGVPAVVRTAVQVLRPRGRLTVNGLAADPALFQSTDLIFKEIEIRGSFIYLDEFEQAIELLARGAIDVEPLISGVVSVENAAEAFHAMRTSTSVIKILVSDTFAA